MHFIDDLILHLIFAAARHQTTRERKLDLLTAAVVRLKAEYRGSEAEQGVLDGATGFLDTLLEPDAIENSRFEILLVTAADLLLRVKVAKAMSPKGRGQASFRYGYVSGTQKIIAANSATPC